MRRRGRPRKEWKEEVEKDLQVLGVRRWRELATDIKNGGIFFDRPKSTAGCSANGRRRRRRRSVQGQNFLQMCFLLGTYVRLCKYISKLNFSAWSYFSLRRNESFCKIFLFLHSV
jgi:hypothetical protein